MVRTRSQDAVNELDHGPYPDVPARSTVTGSSGFVGQRLVELLLERGAEKVVAFDVAPAPADAVDDPRVIYVQGDIRDPKAVLNATKQVDCVFHIAAAVGPFHPPKLYEQVNYGGTLNVLAACRKNGVGKLVFSSSPSTRLTGVDADGVCEDDLPDIPMERYLQEYARTKAMGERAVTDACCASLLTCAVAPHQVYGPRDTIFLPNLLEAAGTGRLRVFGNGGNRICFTHVDNYCHGLMLAAHRLAPGSPVLGQFYIVTDGSTHYDERGCCNLFQTLDEAIVAMGFVSLYDKWSLPYYFIMPLAYLCMWFSMLTGIRLKLMPFNVTMLTMHRWFPIDKATRDLGYKPVVSFRQEWPRTIAWFKGNWLPDFLESQRNSTSGIIGLFSKTQAKIDIQAKGKLD